MKESTKTLTPEESLSLIGKFISNYRKNYQSDSFFFLLWGWVISLASLSHFISLEVILSLKKFELINILSAAIWISAVVTGFVFQYFHIRKKQVKSAVRSHLDKFITVLWQTTGWGIILIALISINLGEYPTPFVLLVAGMATFITGVLIRFNPLKYGGIIFFIFAIIASFVTNHYQLLINSAAIVAGYIIPGYLLKKQQNVVGMFKELDPLLHSQLRLAIMSILIRTREAEFTQLKEETGATSGNLSIQINKLKESGYITVEKKFKGNYPQTLCIITDLGVKKFEEYIESLRKYINP